MRLHFFLECLLFLARCPAENIDKVTADQQGSAQPCQSQVHKILAWRKHLFFRSFLSPRPQAILMVGRLGDMGRRKDMLIWAIDLAGRVCMCVA
jgi:hypothetical protein